MSTGISIGLDSIWNLLQYKIARRLDLMLCRCNIIKRSIGEIGCISGKTIKIGS